MFQHLKRSIPGASRVTYTRLILSALLATALVGCDDDSSKSDLECKTNEDCADRQDGKTQCDIPNNLCVPPTVQNCGNSTIDDGEECDSANLNNKSCTSWDNYVSGNLSCNNSCQFDKSGCVECTDSDLSKCAQNQICSSGHCVDQNHQITCGDKIVEGNEECDDTNLNSKTCADVAGFVDGTLACSECVFDTSDCVECTQDIPCENNYECKNGVCIPPTTKCGNNIIESNEVCDSTNLNDKSCTSWNEFVGGNLSCNNACEFDKSACVECTESDLSKCAKDQICSSGHCVDKNHEIVCGDNIVEGNEACDGTSLNGKSCADFEGFADGSLACNECSFDTAKCVECSKDAHCASREDGKTKCDSNVCVKPNTVSKPKVVISQIYPGAGSTDSLFNTKYVEIFNNSGKSINIADWSIQYGAPANETIAQVCVLPDKTIPQGGYFLVSINPKVTEPNIPTPDYTCPKQMSVGTVNGKFFLVDKSSKLGSSKPDADAYIDLIGYGNANWHEGTAAAPELSSTTAALRKQDGCQDTDKNADDFEALAPKPRNSASPKNYCGGPVPEPVCDNNSLDTDEDCDGSLFKNNKTACADWDPQYNKGNVSCKKCQIDYTNCSYEDPVACNDNKLADSEDCDGNLFKNNKTACGDWDSKYNKGNVTCKNCQIDYTNCSYEAPAACNDNKLSDSEDCDGNLFKDNKTACSAWDPQYNKGTVSCSACQIDYSGCSYVDPSTCLTGQEWSEKYATCVYPISTFSDIQQLSDNWNSKGKNAYPTNDGTDPVFLLKNDISIGTLNSFWAPIGTLANRFEAVFHGDGHKISVSFNGAHGFFDYLYYATIDDLNIDIIKGYNSSQQFIAASAEHTLFNNINIKALWDNSGYSLSQYALFKTVSHSTFNKLTLDINANIKADSSGNTTLFTLKSDNSVYNDVSITATVNSSNYYCNTEFSVFANSSQKDKLNNWYIHLDYTQSIVNSNCQITTSLLASSTDNTKIDKMKLEGGITKGTSSYSTAYFIRDFKNTKISNLQDDTAYNTDSYLRMFYYLNNSKVLNSLINLKYGYITYYLYSGNSYFTNVVLTKNSSVSYYDTYLSSATLSINHNFYQSDYDNGDVKPDEMNNYISSYSFIFESGTYLPWAVDNKGRLYLRFDAPEKDLIVVK